MNEKKHLGAAEGCTTALAIIYALSGFFWSLSIGSWYAVGSVGPAAAMATASVFAVPAIVILAIKRRRHLAAAERERVLREVCGDGDG